MQTLVQINIHVETAALAKGYDAICAFVNADLGTDVIEALHQCGVKLILMRCAGYNNVDLETTKKYGIAVMRVPGYSPEAVAEHAMALVLTANRHTHKAYIKCRENNFALNGLMGVNLYQKTAGIVGTGKIGQAMARICHGHTHKAYIKCRENNFALNGLMGVNLYQKTAGIVGTGKIGQAMARICHGFGMNVIAYDRYPNNSLDFVKYVSLNELLSSSDLISLHCPLTDETKHLINEESISKMKDGVILVNTSRGGLIKTDDLIAGIRDHKFFAVGLDVYEEETDFVYEDMSERILPSSTIQRLLSFPNVTMTSHQGFFTEVGLDVYEEETDFVYEDMSERILPSSTIQRLLSFPNVTMTSHQGFFTEEALTNIAETTLENASAFMNGAELKNQVLS